MAPMSAQPFSRGAPRLNGWTNDAAGELGTSNYRWRALGMRGIVQVAMIGAGDIGFGPWGGQLTGHIAAVLVLSQTMRCML
jgi:hypothetical protein